VLGAGNTGFAVAANLTLAGHSVTLAELPDFPDAIAPLGDSRTIDLMGVANTGAARIADITNDVAAAAAASDTLMVIVPAYGHAPWAEALAPRVRDNHTLTLMPGTLGALEVAQFREIDEEIEARAPAAEVFGQLRFRGGESVGIAHHGDRRIPMLEPGDERVVALVLPRERDQATRARRDAHGAEGRTEAAPADDRAVPKVFRGEIQNPVFHRALPTGGARRHAFGELLGDIRIRVAQDPCEYLFFVTGRSTSRHIRPSSRHTPARSRRSFFIPW